MTFYLNLRTGIETIPLKGGKTIRMYPGKPMQIDEDIEEEMLRAAGGLISEGIVKQITKKEAQDYLQKWETYKVTPAKEMKGIADSYISASARFARQEARQEGLDPNVKKREYYPAW